ncbi:MAG: hypothetical protein ABJO67_01810 [Pseudoruegeria sp.]
MAVRNGSLPGGFIEDGRLRVERLKADVPAEADSLILNLYRRLPEVRITDILTDVGNDTGFTEAFTHLRTGAPCKDRLGLLNVIFAEGRAKWPGQAVHIALPSWRGFQTGMWKMKPSIGHWP